MPSTIFIDYQTPILASWLNDVNLSTYTTVPTLSSTVSTLNSTVTTLSSTVSTLSSTVSTINSSYVNKDGSVAMTGPLVLSGNASSSLQAVPKQQLDAATRAGIGSITITVASNALTGTLAAETLDFRSATLNSGTPVARTTSTSASLTVPSGATLGTANGVQARLVWGWIDNAGTLEPFVCNLAGGINLDETTLINTTAISASSNSSSVIYSQTARTGVAFRVRGFCDITEASAGTWATAPTLVQGVGGQALAALSSLGYGQTWQDVTGSRALGVTYYNTTGRPILVNLNGTSTSSGGFRLVISGVAIFGTTQSSLAVGASIQGLIPPGGSYVASFPNGGTVVLASWQELR